jgi:class 3 adenylate cyclase
MNALREPVRRSAGILFADLEASGELSRTLSSRAYFELIRGLTDVIDAAVDDHGGIIGKHAGDGASALFVVDEDQTASAMARSTIEVARAIRQKAAGLLPDGPDVRINIGGHWGATMTIGQISTSGRLEVTALGDEMNEAARIEQTATGGMILASKMLVERLEPEDAELLGLEPDRLVYRRLSSYGASDKAARDAGDVAVIEI